MILYILTEHYAQTLHIFLSMMPHPFQIFYKFHYQYVHIKTVVYQGVMIARVCQIYVTRQDYSFICDHLFHFLFQAAIMAGMFKRFIWVWPSWDKANHEGNHIEVTSTLYIFNFNYNKSYTPVSSGKSKL